MLRSTSIITLIFTHAISVASAIGNLTSAGCIDVAGFEKCQATATSTETKCLNAADGNTLETTACGCESYIENYNCYAASCWNRVWECEYQEYMTGYFEDCPTAVTPVPYWPAPDNVPDACSCNLGNVYMAVTNSITQGTSCKTNVSNTVSTDATNTVELIADCQCCAESSIVSSIYGLCPNTDPSLIGISTLNTLETTYDQPFSGCDAALSSGICESQLGWPKVAGGEYYGPSNLPKNGTNTLSNEAGTVTSPASGAVFTYTNGANTQVYTISAASVGKAVAATTSSSGKGGSSGSTIATGTGSAAGSAASSAATTKASAADINGPRLDMLFISAVLAMLVVTA